jgi:hypothetical protein
MRRRPFCNWRLDAAYLCFCLADHRLFPTIIYSGFPPKTGISHFRHSSAPPLCTSGTKFSVRWRPQDWLAVSRSLSTLLCECQQCSDAGARAWADRRRCSVVALVPPVFKLHEPEGSLQPLYERATEVVFSVTLCGRASEDDYPGLWLRRTRVLSQGLSEVPRRLDGRFKASRSCVYDPESAPTRRSGGRFGGCRYGRYRVAKRGRRLCCDRDSHPCS